MPTVTIDLQAAQSPGYRDRGVARYALDFTRAVCRRHPELIRQVVLNPALPPIGGSDRLLVSVPVTTSPSFVPGGVFHALSPFELGVPLDQLWPRPAARAGARLVLTVYDLIPELFPDIYLTDPGQRRRYRARRELVRAADHVVTLSQSAADDVVAHLGVPPARGDGRRCRHRGRVPTPGGPQGGPSRGRRRGPGSPGSVRRLQRGGRTAEEHGRPDRSVRAPAFRRSSRVATGAGVQDERRGPAALPGSSRTARYRGPDSSHRVRARPDPGAYLPGGRPRRVPIAVRGLRVGGGRGDRVRGAGHRVRNLIAGRAGGAGRHVRSASTRVHGGRHRIGAYRPRTAGPVGSLVGPAGADMGPGGRPGRRRLSRPVGRADHRSLAPPSPRRPGDALAASPHRGGRVQRAAGRRPRPVRRSRRLPRR